MDADEKVLEAWKATVDVQKHFNELEMRVRSVAVTVLAAFLAAAGYTTREGLELDLFGANVSLTGLVLLAGGLCWLAFYLMDRFWYHRLLRGAVNHGLFIERSVEERFPELGLTKAIGQASPIYVRGKKVGTNQKMDLFYGAILLLLLLAAVGAFANKPRGEQSPPAPKTVLKP